MEIRNQGGTGARLDLNEPFIEGFFPKRDAEHFATVCHTHKHPPTLRIGEGREAFNGCFIEGRLEFKRLRFTLGKHGLDAHATYPEI